MLAVIYAVSLMYVAKATKKSPKLHNSESNGITVLLSNVPSPFYGIGNIINPID
jgi:hypothetical protein